jgi:hypothetical protein
VKNITAAIALSVACVFPVWAAEPVDFAHDVLPLLESRCAECHTNGTYEGGLSLDTRESLLESEVVVPGNSEESYLMERVAAADPDERMPPEGKPLTQKEIALFRAWIDQGLAWQPGFTFNESRYVAPLRPRRPELPPAVDEQENPIDRILSAYYRMHQIERPPPVDDVTFIRRVYLDLIGLLPAPGQLEAFLADEAPDKRARLVRQVLSDDRAYADHWLTFWNDLLRNDYHGPGYIDGGRKQITPWLYRALAENRPYDAFVRELISPTPDSEGFIRGIKWRGNVNASQTRELQFAQNVSQVFLGINMKCASCHDSFIDEWKLADAYGLAAVTAEGPLEIHRCDKPTGETARAKFLYRELGEIDPSLPRAGRLEQLATLMTHEQNGRFARCVVNRLWHRLMGRGIVHPVDVMSNEPFSEDLLDYLAVDLVDHGYDLKAALELIATSRVYQLPTAAPAQPGQGQRFVFRGPLAKRMTAEQLLDAVWRMTATAPAKPVAAVTFPGTLEGKGPHGAGGDPFVRASLVGADALLRSLGRPNREQVVSTRPEELTTLQALELSNGQILADLLTRGAANLEKQHPDWSGEEITAWVYRSALCRRPNTEELAAAETLLGRPMTRESLADLLWAVFMLPEFQLIR